MHKGETVVGLLAALEEAGYHPVYLRNHENLPADVGNDVDILVDSRDLAGCVKVLVADAASRGWRLISTASFSSLAVYFAEPETGEIIHIDLFTRIEWHALSFADVSGILSRRVWNGVVHIPDPRDELFLSLTTRLLYQGVIRDKHRTRMVQLENDGEDLCPLRETFLHHLGSGGGALFDHLRAGAWKGGGRSRQLGIRAAVIHRGFRRPWCLLTGILRYMARSVSKLVHPPGTFISFEGNDLEKHSPELRSLVPWCAEWCAGRAPYCFSGRAAKPDRMDRQAADARQESTLAGEPAGGGIIPRLLASWSGWMFRIYPKLIRSQAVIGRNYGYGLSQGHESPAARGFANRILPAPDLVIFLGGHQDSAGVPAPAGSATEKGGAGRGGFLTIVPDPSPEVTALKIKRAVIAFLAAGRAEG